MGKVSIKGEGIFNLSAQGCWDQQRLKCQDERLITSYGVDFQLVAARAGERMPCLWAQSVQSCKHEKPASHQNGTKRGRQSSTNDEEAKKKPGR